MLYQYGTEVIPLGEYTKKFCLKVRNFKLTNYLVYLEYAQDLWKEFFRKTIWDVKQVGIPLECRKVKLPNDCERLLNVSIVDRHNRITPLTFDANINTTVMKCIKPKCSCNKCGGEGTLCGILDNITMTTTQISINGTDYPQYTFIRYDNCGNIQQSVNAPYWDIETKQVIYRDTISVLCQVSVTECGCIANTPENLNTLQSYCGCSNPYIVGNEAWGRRRWDEVRVIPENYNHYGKWNYNAADRSIIEVDLWHNEPVQTAFAQSINNEVTTFTPVLLPNSEWVHTILITYRTNGEIPDQELLIPAYSVPAMDAGMLYYSALYDRRDGDKQGTFERRWKQENRKLFAYLNPVRIEEVAKVQTNLPRW